MAKISRKAAKYKKSLSSVGFFFFFFCCSGSGRLYFGKYQNRKKGELQHVFHLFFFSFFSPPFPRSIGFSFDAFSVFFWVRSLLVQANNINKHTQMQKLCFLSDRRFFSLFACVLRICSALLSCWKMKPDSMKQLTGIDRH